MIIGDWVSTTSNSSNAEKKLVFSFKTGICSFLTPFGPFARYSVNQDTIIIIQNIGKHTKYDQFETKMYRFYISVLARKKLVLIPDQATAERFFKYKNKSAKDSIVLTRIPRKFNHKLVRIGFFSSECYGSCPSMYLEIDSMGIMRFAGKKFTEILGYYSGKLNDNQLQNLKMKLKAIDLDQIKNAYTAPWTDDQTCIIRIETINFTVESTIYGYGQEPVELRFLIHELMEIYRFVHLKKDASRIFKFHYNDLAEIKYPPPPPPPPPRFDHK